MVYTYVKKNDLKNRARQLTRSRQIPRNQALDEAARLGGFENYAHALRLLPDASAPALNVVTLSQNWFDRKIGRRGTAKVEVSLGRPLRELVNKAQLIGCLSGCTIRSDTELQSDGWMRDGGNSVDDLGRVARALQFMDVTGLKPSRAGKNYPRGDFQNRPPIADHDSCWFDPERRTHVLLTQPYVEHGAMYGEDHLAWEIKHGWQTIPVVWGSLYGLGTRMFLLCQKNYAMLLREKVARLERSPQATANSAVVMGDGVGTRAAA